jgi:Cu/Ag efflux pump CusA
LRFRPIVMTSLAFMLGVAPLVVSTGAGSAARQSMGTGVFGGMLLSTFVATIFVPMFFTLVAHRRESRLQAEAGVPTHSTSVNERASPEALSPPDAHP